MGVDLRLLPVDYMDAARTWGYSHTILDLPRRSEAWASIEHLARPLPKKTRITSYIGGRVKDGRSKDEAMYGPLITDAYDKRYTWIRADELAGILEGYFEDTATYAYINALPPTTWVILDWH